MGKAQSVLVKRDGRCYVRKRILIQLGQRRAQYSPQGQEITTLWDASVLVMELIMKHAKIEIWKHSCQHPLKAARNYLEAQGRTIMDVFLEYE